MLSLATTVNFNQAVYSVDENAGSVRPILVLSNPSSFDIIVRVLTGECYLDMYVYCRSLFLCYT